MSPAELLQWQQQHYAQRLSEALTVEMRAWFRAELYRLKQPNRYDYNNSDNVPNPMEPADRCKHVLGICQVGNTGRS